MKLVEFLGKTVQMHPEMMISNIRRFFIFPFDIFSLLSAIAALTLTARWQPHNINVAFRLKSVGAISEVEFQNA
ncbi:MAG: hypothetical protein PHY43_15235 [Verrucomicrobiales bacterium]|nr:hypothetical protein [Verrucomicrobiales bacterium]